MSRGRKPHPDILTPREWQVLALLREARSNEDIAEALGISVSGVKFHVSEILGKLGVTSRAEAARWRPVSAAPLVFGLSSLKPIKFVLAAASIAAFTASGVVVALLVWGLLHTSHSSRQTGRSPAEWPVAAASLSNPISDPVTRPHYLALALPVIDTDQAVPGDHVTLFVMDGDSRRTVLTDVRLLSASDFGYGSPLILELTPDQVQVVTREQASPSSQFSVKRLN